VRLHAGLLVRWTAASIDRSLGEGREAEALGILSHVSAARFGMLDHRHPTARNRGGGWSQQLFAVEGGDLE
jgi:hypothetical protein